MKTGIRVMAVEDNRADAELLGRYLDALPPWGVEFVICETGEDALEKVREGAFDVIFIDYVLGAVRGTDVVRDLKKAGYRGAFVLLTGVGTEQVAIDALREGVGDYIKKDNLSPEVLSAALRHAADLKKADAALVKEKNNLKQYLEIAGVMIVALDNTGIVRLINKKGSEILGYPEGRIIGRNWFENFVPEEARRQIWEVFHNVLMDEKQLVEYYENPVLTATGEERIIAWHIRRVYNDDGTVGGTLSSGEDITGKRRAEEAIKKQLLFLQTLIETIPNPIFYKGIDGMYLGCNSSFASFLGLPESGIIGKSVFEVASKDLADIYQEKDQALFDSPGQQRYEASVRHADGSRHDVLVYKATFRDIHEKVAGLVGVIIDITESKKSEQSLKESEAKYRTLISDIPGMVYRGFPDWTMEIISNCEDICGYSREEFYSGSVKWPDIIHPDDREMVLASSMDIVNRKLPAVREYRIKGKNGQVRWVEDHLVPGFSEDGALKHVDGVVFDISGRRETEEALRLSEQKFRLMAENAPFALIVGDLSDRYVYCNKKFTEVFGYTLEQVPNYAALARRAFPDEDYRARVAAERSADIARARSEKPHVPPVWRQKVVCADGVEKVVEVTPRLVGDLRYVVFNDITERVGAEDALKESEGKYRSLLDNAADAIFLADLEGNLIEVNKKGVEFLGYSQEEIRKMHFSQLHPRAKVEENYGVIRETMETGSGKIDGTQVRRKDGLVISVDIRASLIEYGGKKTLQGIFRDITERIAIQDRLKRMNEELEIRVIQRTVELEKVNKILRQDIQDRIALEEALTISEKRFRAVVEDQTELICRWHLDGTLTFVNEAYCKYFAKKPEELVGKHFQPLMPAEDREMFARYSEEFVKNKRIATIEHRVFAPNGELRWQAWTDRPIMVGETVVEVQSVGRDITKRKLAEEALRANQLALQTAQQIARLGTWEWDIPANQVVLSDEVYNLLGFCFPNQKIPYEQFIGVVLEEDREMLKKAVDDVLYAQKPLNVDVRIVLEDTGIRVIHILDEITFNEEGKPVKMLGTLQDVTDLKIAEEELKMAKKRAEEATELKDKFVSLVAHDLKNPFNSILGILKLVVRDAEHPLDPKHRYMIGRVISSAEGLLGMIEELLNISRLKTGKVALRPHFMDANLLASTVIANFSIPAEQKGVELVNDVPVGTRIYADPDLIGEVISNLVSNAIKFCRKNDRITLFIPGRKDTVFAVRDTGTGINADILPDLFKHEVKTTTRGTGGESGTGLGLPLCHDIMAFHGGTLTVESIVGQGTVFFASLPFVRPEILVVDDNPSDRYFLKARIQPGSAPHSLAKTSAGVW